MTDDRAPRRGKVDRDAFESVVRPNLGAAREDVRLGPTHGVDFGVVDVADRAVVTATDPISLLPDLGYERAGRFALSFALGDVAVSGVAPTHFCPSFALPSDVSDDEFAAFWAAVAAECEALGVAIPTGHTARYPGASLPWVGAATVLGVGDHDDVIRPDGARPGDRLLVTKGPGIETAGLFASLYPDALADRGLDEATIDDAAALLDETSVVRDALAAAEAGRSGEGSSADASVTAMHDATEGGLRGALCEVSEAGRVRIDVDSAPVPTNAAAVATCEALDLDPWSCTTSGTLLLAVDPAAVDRVVDAVESRSTPVGVVGDVREGSGVFVDGERVEPPAEDASWAAYERLSGTD
ncbi:AIR synthase-related protein [Halobaculum magnesiiphilum]|uniref:Hydrogenase expression protein n=1 Tax=Halobaculum magnesiiphilum TaxID=1017351 RepID=A0A8T8WF44_9EURY|nr:AIR synthase-related protein [Halobaculum magnesiiphilum]QZP38512.1 hydrogenase expression protein [Halobaculum magnesiiphilum]